MKLTAADFNAGNAANCVGLKPRASEAVPTTAGVANPLTVIARMARQLDLQNVESQGRWLVIDPVFVELLKDEDSRLFDSDFGGSGLQNGLILNNLHGLKSMFLTTCLLLVQVHLLQVELMLITLA